MSSDRRPLFETLEPRLLLSADPLSVVVDQDAAAELTLQLGDASGTPILQLIDRDAAVLAEQALAATSEVSITGSELADVLHIDGSLLDGLDTPLFISFDAAGDSGDRIVVHGDKAGGSTRTWPST